MDLFILLNAHLHFTMRHKKATFSTEEIRLMRITINRLRNERLGKGQYTDAADDMLLKLF